MSLIYSHKTRHSKKLAKLKAEPIQEHRVPAMRINYIVQEHEAVVLI